MKIQILTLYTSNLKNQFIFYRDTLGFEVLEESHSSFTLKTGHTKLTFVSSENATPYHFAFNIPAYQEDAALTWLKSKVDVLTEGGLEIMDFDDWQAKAVYFYDADNNIVEVISRRRIESDVQEPFTIDSVLSISEIGLVTDEIEPIYQKLNDLGIEIFDGNMYRFCAAGNDNGLFIIINPKVKNWFPTDEKAFYSPFEVVTELRGVSYNLKYIKNNLQIA
jgi:catechol-2,3-dioxygenase